MLLLACLFSIGCGDVLGFELKTDVDEFTIPGNATLNAQHVGLTNEQMPPIEIKLEGIQATSVKLTNLRFYVTTGSLSTSADADTLEFLEEVVVDVIPTSSNSKLPPLRLGTWSGPADAGATEIEVSIESDADLKDYIYEGAKIRVTPAGIVPADDISIMGEITFFVEPI
jgi:hypothetical protein